jgi:mannose-6-phosphate isomerase-like protein (cupin superfamily)/SAM-dependent methyltransferase
MSYVLSVSAEPSYSSMGLAGYALFADKDLDIDYIDVVRGHDTFHLSKKVSRFYYIISGKGYFTIHGTKYDVQAGQLVLVPPRVEYSYSGTMSLLLLTKPHWFRGNDITTRWNPDVVSEGCAEEGVDRPRRTRIAQCRVLGVSPVGAFLRMNRTLWDKLPESITGGAVMRRYGTLVYRLARLYGNPGHAPTTWFFRNRAALELMRRVAEHKGRSSLLKVAVLGCQTGAEIYSIVWWLRSLLSGLKLAVDAVDANSWAVEFGKRGIYTSEAVELTGEGFCRMTEGEKDGLFDRVGITMSVKPWLREGVRWHVADVWDAALPSMIGIHDIVVANNCLSGVDAGRAENALRNIARLVGPGGYLFVKGADLEARTRVAKDLGWISIQELLEEVHEEDPWLRHRWPWHHAGLEPIEKGLQDWRIRYAAAFQVPPRPSRESL